MNARQTRVFFVTLPNGYFGSAGKSWLSLSIDKISKKLMENCFSVISVPVDRLLATYQLQEHDIVIYTSSENSVVRNYIKDVMYIVNKKCTIIPSYDLLMAHENKGFQELYKLDRRFGNLNGTYHIDHKLLSLEYPYVYKSITGAGSTGVHLIRNQKERDRIVAQNEKTGIKRRIINLVRFNQLDAQQYALYKYNKKRFSPYVVQPFIEGLTFDYKVLVFWNKFYVLKRNIKNKDFRASGSGLFEFESPSDELLDYASDVFGKLNTPYASLDIALSNNGCRLIEFQSLNFGPYTLVNSPGFYQKINENWQFFKASSSLEDEFSNSLAGFVCHQAGC